MTKILKIGKYKVYQISCPGCKTTHNINCDPEINGAWKIENKTDEKLTVIPELKISLSENKLCEFSIKNGKIIYSKNCTHKLAGETVVIPEIKNTL